MSTEKQSRREFIRSSGLIALAMQMPLGTWAGHNAPAQMGVVVHSYGARWQSRFNSQRYPGFGDAIQLLEHCKRIGAAGIQVGVSGWNKDFSASIRRKSENLNMYLEGSIALPKSKEDLERFEKEIITAKSAGVTVFRTVCLGGRRYETFQTQAEFEAFREQSLQSLQWSVPIVEKHRIKLAVENHKDWTAAELVDIINCLGSAAVGVTLDFGNNISLLEDPDKVIEVLAPIAFSTHIKDMAVQPYEKGFLLSEIPLGKGKVDLAKGVALCRKHNPEITFNLEMITRDPLEIPCLTSKYWATFGQKPAIQLAEMMEWVRKAAHSCHLPKVAGLTDEEKLDLEERNILESFAFPMALR